MKNIPPPNRVKAIGNLIVSQDESIVLGKFQEDRRVKGARAELIRRWNDHYRLIDVLHQIAKDNPHERDRIENFLYSMDRRG